MRSKHESVLPKDWYRELFDKADLERSFQRLEGIEHFYAAAMRGRIRSLQMRLDDAWEHLDEAADGVDKVPVNIPNLVRAFLLNIYSFENALLANPVDRSSPPPNSQIPEIPDEILEKYPEVGYVVSLRLSAEGTLRLHLGDFHVSSMIFQGLVQSYNKPPDAVLAMHYAGLAAAQHNLGLEAKSRENLENAALALHSGGDLLNRAKVAGILWGLHSALGDEQESGDWAEYLRRLECPEATREAFLERSRLLVERCALQDCLLVM